MGASCRRFAENDRLTRGHAIRDQLHARPKHTACRGSCATASRTREELPPQRREWTACGLRDHRLVRSGSARRARGAMGRLPHPRACAGSSSSPDRFRDGGSRPTDFASAWPARQLRLPSLPLRACARLPERLQGMGNRHRRRIVGKLRHGDGQRILARRQAQPRDAPLIDDRAVHLHLSAVADGKRIEVNR